jgi:two-component system sensor kinase FixL
MSTNAPGVKYTAATVSPKNPNGRPENRDGLRLAASALLVALSYYVGANIGLILRFPAMTPSVLWPPNSILTSALLLTPVPRWWFYLLAALPAHLLATAGQEWPLLLVVVVFVTNCSEAILAASAVRRWSDAPRSLDSLKRVLVFVAGVGLLAPFVSSFLDAAVVAGVGVEPYWEVWRTRFLSNILAALTVAPAVVTAATLVPSWIRRARLVRQVEMAGLVIGLALISIAVLGGPAEWLGPISNLPHVPVALFLPILLWAAVRFGPGGVSAATLATTLVLTWAATHGRGPFATLEPSASVLALQGYLIVSVVPLMCLAGLIEERRRAQLALRARLRFEEFVARLSGSFVHLPSDQMGATFDAWLARIGALLALDHVWLLHFSADGADLGVAHAWDAPGLGPMAPVNMIVDYPWTVTLLRHEKPLIVERLDQVPLEAARDCDALRRWGVRSKLLLPLLAGNRVVGGLAFVTVTADRAWPDEEVGRLRLVAEVFASALARKESEDALRASEGMKSAILGSLDTGIVVLDRLGGIITVNSAWTRFAPDWARPRVEPVDSASYLHVCQEAARQGEARAFDLLAGIETVLGGTRSRVALEYASQTPRGERWFAMSVVALGRPEGGAVVSSAEITERKRAEVEAQRSDQELAHVTRVSAMGELTASIAHELNQPLSGILFNAQAARRFLDLTPPPLQEIRSILTDIVQDDKRAADVIRRLREFLRKGETDMRVLDLNGLVQDVVGLLGSDLVIRNIQMRLDLAAATALVKGDRVQLQQVILNLLLNAVEAMTDSDQADRTLTVRTRLAERDLVRVSVADTGPGLPAGTEEMMFEPFYTTKPTGMGMGLAIARSIIAAHGGTIAVEANLARGATFHVSLPSAGAPA